MAPSRGKGKARVYPLRKSSPAQGSRRTARTSAQRNRDTVPEVYKDMLAEASADNADDTTSDRPLKKRKIQRPTSTNKVSGQRLQTVEDSSASSDDSDVSEFEFEDVDLHQPTISSPTGALSAEDGIADISVAVDTKAPKRTPVAKRKAATPAEKAHRLLVHRLHILCLLGHVMYVNTWCNDSVVHEHLLELLSQKTASYLTHNPEHSQFQQNRSFMDCLQQASEAWRGAFKISASGIRRARWSDPDVEPEVELDPLDRQEFRKAAKELESSQDIGNQLFCALLRAVDVEARIVCSLQVLPFGLSSKDKVLTPKSDGKKIVYATTSGRHTPTTDSNTEDATMQNSATVGRVPSTRRRLGQPSFPTTPPTRTATPKKKRPLRKLTYPVFWVEAFNRAHQTWVPVDPLVTQTIGKASKLEPPASYEWNQMSYVIAFESDGVARDVTKRYAKAYNAKTRRLRVENAEQNGAAWLRRALRLFRRPRSDDTGRDRDQIENSQLAQREAQEGLPNTVQDFKHHPYYALERHLRRHEVIHPRREVGKVNAGTPAKPRMEVVFRRSDVQSCKSADKWFRVGREIKKREQPLKRVPARRSRNATVVSADEEGDVEMVTALYAPFQTTLYIPPPVVKGRVPRNAYGNLDIYVPSMVPPGGAHIRHPLAKEAARTLRVDAVDAVTGFKFQGRQGTAVVEGVIVAEEHKEAVEAAIEALQDDQTEHEGMARSALALKMWRRFLTALRIKERVSAYGDGTVEGVDDVDMVEDDNDSNEAAGGFLTEGTDHLEEQDGLPTAGKYSLAELLSATPSKRSRAKARTKEDTDENEEADFSDAESVAEEEGGFEPDVSATRARRSRRHVIEDDEEEDMLFTSEQNVQSDSMPENEGGGFFPDGDLEGGFLVDEEQDTATKESMQGDEGGGGFVVDEQDFAEPRPPLDRSDEPLSGEPFEEDISVENHENSHMANKSTTPTPRARTPTCDGAEGSGVATALTTEESIVETAHEGEPVKSTGEDDVAVEPSLPGWQVHGLAEAQEHIWPDEADNDSDHGSMLSHDPEDEDAEPDWLESD